MFFCKNIDLQNSFKLSNKIEPKRASTKFDTNIFFNSKEYQINNDILREIYISIKFIIEEIECFSEWDLNEIETNLIARISKTEKINYLENKYKELILEVQKEPEYFIFTGEKEFNGFDNWEELVINLLENEVLLIEKYLTTNFNFNDIPKQLFNDWQKYFRVKYFTDFC